MKRLLFFVLMLASNFCMAQGIELSCPSGTNVLSNVGALVNWQTGGSRQWLCYDTNGNVSVTFAGPSPLTSSPSIQVGPVIARTTAFNGTPSVNIQEQAGFNPLEIHSNHQTGIDIYTHDNTVGVRAPTIDLLRSRGTQSTPLTVQVTDFISLLNFGGFDGSTYNVSGAISQAATENWTPTHHGSSTTFQVTANGTTSLISALTLTNLGQIVIPQIFTVATLPTCNAGLRGALSQVSDASAPTYNTALTGGGAIIVPVYCNGTAWTSH